MHAPNGVVQGLQSKRLKTILLWCRRDLRVTDNPALNAAIMMAEQVIPVYIWAPEEEGQFTPGRCSRWWLNQSLASFEQDLRAMGSGLVFRRASESRTALLQLVRETGAQGIVFNHLYDPISLVRDNEVKRAMHDLQLHCQSFNGDVLYEPWEILASNGQPFTNFNDFWQRMCSMEHPPKAISRVPDHMPKLPQGLQTGTQESLQLLTADELICSEHLTHNWMPGGRGSFVSLEKFVNARLQEFTRDRAKTDRLSTSCLSPYIHYGELSIRFVFFVVKQRAGQDGQHRKSCEDYLRQIGYREYSRYLSFHFPFTHERSLLEHLRATPWRFDHRHFKAWRQGNTGYPMVDASMRQLWSTGWLHNRSRVICASFLVKNLLLPWQWGLKHYWDCLLDADLECDALGWQYCSGCLADALPFDYMMDEVVEAKKFDPDGNYVRRWLPALARLPLKWIHKPWEAPEKVLQDAGVELGVTYPYPIISQEESQKTLEYAAKIIQKTLLENPNSKVPYRPPSVPSNDPEMVPDGSQWMNGLAAPKMHSDVSEKGDMNGTTPMDMKGSEQVFSNTPPPSDGDAQAFQSSTAPQPSQANGPSSSELRARTAAGALRDAAQRLNDEEEAMAAVVPSMSQTEKNKKVADGLANMDNASMGGGGPDHTHHAQRSSTDSPME